MTIIETIRERLAEEPFVGAVILTRAEAEAIVKELERLEGWRRFIRGETTERPGDGDDPLKDKDYYLAYCAAQAECKMMTARAEQANAAGDGIPEIRIPHEAVRQLAVDLSQEPLTLNLAHDLLCTRTLCKDATARAEQAERELENERIEYNKLKGAFQFESADLRRQLAEAQAELRRRRGEDGQ